MGVGVLNPSSEIELIRLLSTPKFLKLFTYSNLVANVDY
jgi:hypothetical protein